MGLPPGLDCRSGVFERTRWRLFVVAALAAAHLTAASALPALAAATTQVHIVGGAPSPAEVTIDDGDFVEFVNDDDGPHAIFALGDQRGTTIPPHRTSDAYGPFRPENGGNTFPYRIDEDGPEGLIVVRSTETSTTTPPESPSPPASAFPSPTAGTTTTTAPSVTSPTPPPPTPTTTPTTRPSSATNAPAPVVVRESKETSPLLAVAGVALILAGTAGLVLGRFRSRRPTPPP